MREQGLNHRATRNRIQELCGWGTRRRIEADGSRVQSLHVRGDDPSNSPRSDMQNDRTDDQNRHVGNMTDSARRFRTGRIFVPERGAYCYEENGKEGEQ
jgi:hypothetical protein